MMACSAAANRSSPSVAIDDRRRLVGPVDRDLLGDVVGGRPFEPGRAHQDQRLGRQVDVLLVLGGVAGDRLVAELRELDPHLLGRDPVGAVADDRPVARRRRQAARPSAIAGRRARTSAMASGSARSALEQLVGVGAGSAAPDGVGDGRGRGGSRRRPGRRTPSSRHRHLDVAAVGVVEHAVGLVDQVAVAPVDDGDHRRAAAAHQVDGAVGVGRRARLADGDDQRVGHVVGQLEARQLGGERTRRCDPQAAVEAAPHGARRRSGRRPPPCPGR